ncbi:hypothetical protein Tco_1235688, partial [Tanacetum coccineum]
MARSPGYTRLGSRAFTPRTLRSPSKPDRAHIYIIMNNVKKLKRKGKSQMKTRGETEEDDPEYFDTFFTVEELSSHEWLLKKPRPPWVSAK